MSAKIQILLSILLGGILLTGSKSSGQVDTQLLNAVHQGNINFIARALHQNDINEVYDNNTRFGTTLICRASCEGKLDMVIELLESGASVTIKKDYVHDALKESVNCQQAQMVDWYLNTDLYKGISQDHLESLLFLTIDNDDTRTFDALLNHAPIVQSKDKYTEYMFAAAHNNKPQIFMHLVSLGADIHTMSNNSEFKGEHVAHIGASCAPILNYLTAQGIDVNITTSKGQTPLHLSQNVEAVGFLLNQGMEVNARDQYGWTPLHYAALDGDIAVVTKLLQAGAEVNVASNEELNVIHLEIAVAAGATPSGVIDAVFDYYANDSDRQQAYQKIKTLLQ